MGRYVLLSVFVEGTRNRAMSGNGVEIANHKAASDEFLYIEYDKHMNLRNAQYLDQYVHFGNIMKLHV